MLLEQFGWSPHFAEALENFDVEHLPGRVSWASRDSFRLWTAEGETESWMSGKLRHSSFEDWPVVGDWVAHRNGVIEGVLPRRTRVVRRMAGNAAAPQVLAANVDALFLVTGLDGDFNIRRIERYLYLAYESGAEPVVVLNKADLVDEVGPFIARVRASAPGIPVIPMSALRGDGVDALLAFLEPGRTGAFLGSSGAGKSTIINRLLGEDRRATAAVRLGDSRGRHTTSDRQLMRLDSGQLLMDLPGLREIQLWIGEEGLERTFADVAELARECRFRDCRHQGEPGCAVREALGSGLLDPARFGNYLKMKGELQQLERRTDLSAAQAEKRRWKSIHKSMRNFDKRR